MSFVPRETGKKITDWFLSKETFVLEYHKDLDSYQTIGVPDDLSFYYKSDRYLSHQKNKSLVSQVYQALKSRRNQWKKKLVLKSLSNKPKAESRVSGVSWFRKDVSVSLFSVNFISVTFT